MFSKNATSAVLTLKFYQKKHILTKKKRTMLVDFFDILYKKEIIDYMLTVYTFIETGHKVGKNNVETHARHETASC